MEQVLWVRCPSSHPTNSVRALKETQTIDPNQEKLPTGLNLSSTTIRLLREGAMVPLYQLSEGQ